MNKETGKKTYRKPRLTSEKIFEQAALACSGYNMGSPSVVTGREALKNNGQICQYAHS
ncbi:MAG: hypothetical protein GXP25_07500 [Planctomycetes bacterium]|nr:hypothetical protein [Planctomycetota bacterium]